MPKITIQDRANKVLNPITTELKAYNITFEKNGCNIYVPTIENHVVKLTLFWEYNKQWGPLYNYSKPYIQIMNCNHIGPPYCIYPPNIYDMNDIITMAKSIYFYLGLDHRSLIKTK